MKLTEFQHRVLYALAYLCTRQADTSCSDIARILRMPKHKLAVSSALRGVFSKTLLPDLDYKGQAQSSWVSQRVSGDGMWVEKVWHVKDLCLEYLGYKRVVYQSHGHDCNRWELESCRLP